MKISALLMLLWPLLWGQARVESSCFAIGGENNPHRDDIHEQWDVLLKRHVQKDGLVSYQGFLKDKDALNAYLTHLSGQVPSAGNNREEKLAYYMNLYNAATVKLIVDHYPLQSIKDLKSPWDSKWIPIGGELLSLGEIEHKILRKMEEPRIHFAINCASYSCPKLLNFAFRAQGLETQLDQAAKGFIQDSSRNRISRDKLELSQIFQWYKRDFTEQGSLIDYLNRYSDIEISANARVSYLKYDWSLNEAR